MYKKVNTDLNFVEREHNTLKFWQDNQIFEKSVKEREGCPTYMFYDGPPTANGKPHIGHVLTRVIKDMVPRYRTMKGYQVPRKAGWDTHGLPVELEVEKEIGIEGKEQIEEYGIAPFVEKCKESVWKYKSMWEEFSGIVGFWADMDNPYVTYYDDYIESEWWALKEIWKKGLLYKGFKVVPYCPSCGTPLSSHEVAQGYKTLKERSAIVRFKVVGEDAYFLAWTTTPWTLPSNIALCVNPEDTYAKVKAIDGCTYYMAEALLDKVLEPLKEKYDATADDKAYEVLETMKGKDLEYKPYEPLYEEAARRTEQQHKKKRGHQFGPDTVWQKELEELFPYEETDDQLAAIEDTKKDMESDRIMDRLICGDVGYGKTEIAVRAAFKAVMEGMQVAVLVPTTILAQQHYNTFVERMRRYPVTIGMLSRFRTPAEQKQTISEVKEGICDIVIGTHRLLSKDVKFKNLGLLVVDEEQRFGVTHKEKIKKMKENVDVLTLSATPIPRTLHMSLVGIRDMSVLEEAPEGRVPIQTYVMEYDEEMVREAIIRELSRKGQVYYVHNRVNDIDSVTASLQQLVPEARVAFAHGRMGEEQLEKIMYDFIDGEIDVLVSTTIIETGLDISNVNTIIIRESDKMGLSQLYQLRGRVGRTGRTSFISVFGMV